MEIQEKSDTLRLLCNVVRFYAHRESEEKEDGPWKSVQYNTYEITYLMAGRITAFAGIATSGCSKE